MFIPGKRPAKRFFEEEAEYLAQDPLQETFEPTRREQVAQTGEWQALKDIHPKTVYAIENASSASTQDERKRHLRTVTDEFGKEFYALRKQIVWPVKQNVTAAVGPPDKVPAAERKSIGRRKPRPEARERNRQAKGGQVFDE